MTVSTTTSRADYTGNGTTTAFAVPFYFLDDSHLTVLRTQISTGVITTLAITTNYTVSGAGNPAGGTVTCVVAPTTDQKISILRNVPLTQLNTYVPNDPFPAASHERALDKLTMEVQQLDEAIDRALTLPANTPAGTVSTALPTPAANQVIGWNGGATGLQNINAQTLASIVSSGNTYSDLFSGDGVATTFTLSASPGSISNLDVSISGVTQRPGIDYTWVSGTTLTISPAPASGTNNILVRYSNALPQGVATKDAQSFDTVAIASASAIDISVNHIRTAGYYVNGDGGGALYKRVPSAPAHNCFITSNSGAVFWELAEKAPNVVQAGADPTGVSSSVTAFTNAAALSNHVIVPAGVYNLPTQPVFGSASFIIERGVSATGAYGGASVFTDAYVGVIRPASGSTDFSTLHSRRQANHTGGTPFYTNAAVRGETYVSAGVTNFEWAVVGKVDNSATGGQNVGVYGQGLKRSGAGPTWGMTTEVYDYNTDPTSGAVAIEVDVRGAGTDANNTRVGVDIFAAQAVDGAAADCEVYAAIRTIGYNFAVPKNVGKFKNALIIESATQVGVLMKQTGITGIDFSTATISNEAIKLGTGNTKSINLGSSAVGTSPFLYGDASNHAILRLGATGELRVRNSGDTFNALAVNTSGDCAIGTTVVSGTRLQMATSNLGTGAGNTAKALNIATNVGNTSQLDITARRHTAGSDWIGTNVRVQRNIDGTQMGFIDFGVNGSSGNTGLGFGSGTTTNVTFTSGGDVLLVGAGGLGYGTGSGGTVTQGAGSGKATAVTLNKTNGQITLNNAALNAATTVSFTLTNSTIAATDFVMLNILSGGTWSNYALNAVPAAGSATINVRNISAGSLSDALVLQFVVIKSVTA